MFWQLLQLVVALLGLAAIILSKLSRPSQRGRAGSTHMWSVHSWLGALALFLLLQQAIHSVCITAFSSC